MAELPELDLTVSLDNLEADVMQVVIKVRPEWKDQEITSKMFTDGFTNRLVGVFIKEYLEDMMLVRVYGENTDLFIDRIKERRNMILMFQHGLAAPLLAAFNNGLCYGFTPGRTVDRDLVMHPVVSKFVAIQLARMHFIESGKKSAGESFHDAFKRRNSQQEEAGVSSCPSGPSSSLSSDFLPTSRSPSSSVWPLGEGATPCTLNRRQILPGEGEEAGTRSIEPSLFLVLRRYLVLLSEESPHKGSTITLPTTSIHNNNQGEGKNKSPHPDTCSPSAPSSSSTSSSMGHEEDTGLSPSGSSHPIRKPYVPSLQELGREVDFLTSFLPSQESPVVFCHNDLLLKNIIYNDKSTDGGSDSIRFIDFEYADLNYQAHDVANHFCEFGGLDGYDPSQCPGPEFRSSWIHHYLTEWRSLHPDHCLGLSLQQHTTRMVHQVNVFLMSPHLMWGLWSLLQSRHSTIRFDYRSYAAMRFHQYFEEKDRILKQKKQKEGK